MSIIIYRTGHRTNVVFHQIQYVLLYNNFKNDNVSNFYQVYIKFLSSWYRNSIDMVSNLYRVEISNYMLEKRCKNIHEIRLPLSALQNSHLIIRLEFLQDRQWYSLFQVCLCIFSNLTIYKMVKPLN